jgi:hypothetical protein
MVLGAMVGSVMISKLKRSQMVAIRGAVLISTGALAQKRGRLFPLLLYHLLSTRTLPFWTIFFCALSRILRRHTPGNRFSPKDAIKSI